MGNHITRQAMKNSDAKANGSTKQSTKNENLRTKESFLNDPRYRGTIVENMARTVGDGSYDLHKIPDYVIRVINENFWQHYISPTTDEEVFHKDFNEFVTAKFPQGLGTTLETLRKLCHDNEAALGAIRRVCERPHGGDRVSEKAKESKPTNSSHGRLIHGTTKDYGLRRLEKQRPDLHQRVLAKELSVHAACVEAGFRKKPTALEQAKKFLQRLTDDEFNQLVELEIGRRGQ